MGKPFSGRSVLKCVLFGMRAGAGGGHDIDKDMFGESHHVSRRSGDGIHYLANRQANEFVNQMTSYAIKHASCNELV
jgi:hypothetical protein